MSKAKNIKTVTIDYGYGPVFTCTPKEALALMKRWRKEQAK